MSENTIAKKSSIPRRYPMIDPRMKNVTEPTTLFSYGWIFFPKAEPTIAVGPSTKIIIIAPYKKAPVFVGSRIVARTRSVSGYKIVP